jgi:DMSO/TMAO reductase YedYZ molybdopterin-dependent catalytic subunit
MTSPEVAVVKTGTSRRAFLTSGAAALLAACGWDGGTPLHPVMTGASLFNDWFSERLFSSTQPAPKSSESLRSNSFPNYHISDMTPEPEDPAAWRLEVGGLVSKPLSLSIADIQQMTRTAYTVEHHCVEGWSAVASWAGTPLRAVVERAGVRPEARYVRFDSFDSEYYNGWDLKSAMHPETILAYAFNDRPIMPDHGAPLRLYAPHKLGYKLTKYLTRITFTKERPGGYWEDQGYPWFGGL